jgi:hypothetical protein
MSAAEEIHVGEAGVELAILLLPLRHRCQKKEFVRCTGSGRPRACMPAHYRGDRAVLPRATSICSCVGGTQSYSLHRSVMDALSQHINTSVCTYTQIEHFLLDGPEEVATMRG